MQDLILPHADIKWLVELQAQLGQTFTEDEAFKALVTVCIAEMEVAMDEGRLSALKYMMPDFTTSSTRSMKSFLALYDMRLLTNGNGTYGMRSDGLLLADRAKLWAEFLAIIGTSNIPLEHLEGEAVGQWLFRNAERIKLHGNYFSDSSLSNVVWLLRAYGYGLKRVKGTYLMRESEYDVVPMLTDVVTDLDDMVRVI